MKRIKRRKAKVDVTGIFMKFAEHARPDDAPDLPRMRTLLGGCAHVWNLALVDDRTPQELAEEMVGAMDEKQVAMVRELVEIRRDQFGQYDWGIGELEVSKDRQGFLVRVTPVTPQQMRDAAPPPTADDESGEEE